MAVGVQKHVVALEQCSGLHRFIFFSPLQFYLRNDIFFITMQVLLLRRIFMCPLIMLKMQCEMRQNGAVVLDG